MKKSDIFWQTYLSLEKEALELSKYIFFTDEVIKNSKGTIISESCNSQLETFSPYIADLLVRCCVQIEAISKELYFDIGGTKQRGDKDLFFDEDCLKEIDKKWETSKKIVLVVSPSFNFTKDVNRILKPLKKAHKRQGTYWEKAYQAVKHDRYSSMHQGNIKAFIHALAALYLLNIYYRNESWITKYQDISKADYSLGSAIFAVNPPVAEQLWYGNNPVVSESPFVVQYQEADYKRIEEIQKKEQHALNGYLMKQSELQDPVFIQRLQEAIQQAEANHGRVIPIWELAEYRLNQKVPATLSFEERKDILIHSEEWNGWIHQHNPHLKAEEITEENIQEEIDKVGRLWGMELTKRGQPMEWIQIAMNSNICKVFIPQ
ncbi:MAG: hypothetical protein II723_00510 [Oscillospiraceae bacterium]|nr:hypothetical protein [Oscillospiraceae bacterium]